MNLLPPEHEQAGRLTVAVTGLDDEGEMVAGQCLRLARDEPLGSATAEALCKRPQR